LFLAAIARLVSSWSSSTGIPYLFARGDRSEPMLGEDVDMFTTVENNEIEDEHGVLYHAKG
jgi:hypothetical protein